MPKFAMGAPPELLKGDRADMQQLRQYLMQLCDVLGNTLNSLDDSNMRPAGLTSASFKNLSVEVLGAARAELAKAKIGWAQVQHLETQFAKIVTSTIETADINWANILALTTEVARIAALEVEDADISYAHIKDLTTDKAIITKGVNGKLYVAELAVTEANMVSLTAGELVVKGKDGRFYAIGVAEDGSITTEVKQVGNDDVKDASINAGEKIIEGTVTAANLNAKDIFADNALIRQLMAANIDVDTLFGREATLNKINTMDITSNSYLQLMVKGHRAVYTQYDQPEGDMKPGDRWIRISQPALTWADLGKMTWAEIGALKWGEIYKRPVTYVWDGGTWVMTGDEPGRVENASVMIDVNGIEMRGGCIRMNAGTAIRIVSGGALDMEGGELNVKAGSALKVRSGGMLDVEGGTVNLKAASKLKVQSGGALDLEGGTMSVNSGAAMKVKSGGALEVEGGSVKVKAGSAMKIESGGTFEIESDNFDVTPEGNVSMKDATVSGNLAQDGYTVLTKRNLIISTTQPKGQPDVVWIKPVSNVTLTYRRSIAGVTSFETFNTAKALDVQGSAASASGTTYRYTLRIPYKVVGSPLQTRTLTAKLSGSAGTLTMTAQLSNTLGYAGTLELTATASFWLGAASSINLTMTLAADNTTEDYDYHRITPGCVELSCSAKSSSASGWTSAEVYVYQ
ncbi:MAG: hypothetical protein E7316_02315 [Clostridiales bacterium]|nr:hypothetical protein [Clostridiales bacterium]